MAPKLDAQGAQKVAKKGAKIEVNRETPKMDPKWIQNGTKMESKCCQDAPKMLPGCSQRHPKCSQGCAKMPPRCFRGVQDAPRLPRGAPKMFLRIPRCSQDASKADFGTQKLSQNELNTVPRYHQNDIKKPAVPVHSSGSQQVQHAQTCQF